MNRRLLFLIVICLVCRPAVARIGETDAEVANRYGAPTDVKNGYYPNHKLRLYEFNGFTILVHFYNGISQSEAFQKAGKEEMTDNEVLGLMRANAGSGRWEATYADQRIAEFKSGDERYAMCEKGIGYLLMETVAFKSWLAKAKAAAEQQNMSGF